MRQTVAPDLRPVSDLRISEMQKAYQAPLSAPSTRRAELPVRSTAAAKPRAHNPFKTIAFARRRVRRRRAAEKPSEATAMAKK